jgi:DnaJ family protein C protein 28
VFRYTAASLYLRTFVKEARAQGRFGGTKGRGKPMVISDDEKNPFVGREEFLMNRIVQRNGAAPPWVELQAGKLRFVPAFIYQIF